jgi:hypothetical protein
MDRATLTLRAFRNRYACVGIFVAGVTGVGALGVPSVGLLDISSVTPGLTVISVPAFFWPASNDQRHNRHDYPNLPEPRTHLLEA